MGKGGGVNPMRLVRERRYDTEWQSREVLGVGVVTADLKINRES